MALWGNKDTKAITGTIAVVEDSAAVVGTGTTFTTQLKTGQTLVIVGVEYRVEKITDNTHLTLKSIYTGVDASGLTVTANEQPAYVPVSELSEVFGVDVTEEGQAEVKAIGAQHAGWVKYHTYTDQHGNVRNKSETLVAMGSISGDAADDAVFPDRTITISVQPASASVVAPATNTFTVTAAAVPTATLTYQWQKQESSESGTTWTNVGTNSSSYTTGATAVTPGAGATNGDKYRVVITATGASAETSSVAVLTVTA